MYLYSEPSPFPPSFEGSSLAYGFGLFGDVVAAALSLAMLFSYAFEAKRNKEAARIAGYSSGFQPTPIWSPLYIYRTANISMLLFVVLRCLPDAIWMLAWGEVGETAIKRLLLLDLWMDAAALGPFFMSCLCWTWGRQIIPHQLLQGLGAQASTRPDWSLVWRSGRIVVIVLVIAIGVTVGKASA